MTAREPVSIDIGRYTALRSCRNGLTLFNRLDWCIGASLLAYGEFSIGEQELFKAIIRPTDVVVEAGAHIGCHTVALSRMCDAVYAFEAQRLVFQMLCANLALGECKNVQAWQAVVGKECGKAFVPCQDPALPWNTGGVQLRGVTEGEPVGMVTVDSMNLDYNFLKADVEDMELEVVLGALESIERCRPILYLESNNNHRPLVELVDSLGYQMYWHCPKIFSPDNINGREDDIFSGVVSVNILCIPKETKVEGPGRRIQLTDGCLDTGVQGKTPSQLEE